MITNGPGSNKPYRAYKDSGVEWLGNIPEHWITENAKWLFAEVVDRDHPGEPLLSVTQSNGVLPREDSEIRVWNPSDDVSGYKLVQPDDFVISLRSFEGGIEHSVCRGIISPAYTVLRPRKAIEPGYFHHLLKSEAVVSALNSITTGIRQGKNISYADFALLPCPIPPLSEQQAIGRFLDHKTSEIDALIAAKEHLITLLQEKRAALITHAVTKGLDPSAPIRDSGIEWLGRIPAHWEVIRLRYITDKFVDYRGKTPEKTESGIPLITARNIGEGYLDFSLSQEYIREEDYSQWMVRGFPEVGDVLLTTEAPLGHAAQIVDTYVALAQRLMLIKGRRDMINHKYLMQYFLSGAGQRELYSRATGSTAIGIKASWLKTISILMPPLHEQRAIVNFIAQQEEPIRESIEKINEAIERLNEYRTALISAAVTGKIDVRDC